MGGKESLNPNPSRCFQCLTIPFIDIITNDLDIQVKTKCLCGEKEEKLEEYMKKHSGKEMPDFSCFNCKKLLENSYYCHECLKVFCNKCSPEHKSNNKNHSLTPLNKLDTECPFHSKVFTQYCFICEKNLCDKCNLIVHKGHIIIKYIDYKVKKMDVLEKKIKMAKQKLNVNEDIAKSIINKNDKMKKEIEEFYEINDEMNLKIIKLLEQIIQSYSLCKEKFNCQLIYNVKENINFNLGVISFDENTKIEEDTEKLIHYFKTNTIIVKRDDIKERKKKLEEKKHLEEEKKKQLEEEEKKKHLEEEEKKKHLEEEEKKNEEEEEKKNEEENKENEKKEIFTVDLYNYGNKYSEKNQIDEIYDVGDPRKEERDNIMKRPIRNIKKKAKRPVFTST